MTPTQSNLKKIDFAKRKDSVSDAENGENVYRFD